MCCTGESAHIQSNFRQNNFCTSSGNARDFVYCLNRCLDPEIGCTRNMTGCCPIHQAFGRISGTVRRMLAEETFYKLLAADCKK